MLDLQKITYHAKIPLGYNDTKALYYVEGMIEFSHDKKKAQKYAKARADLGYNYERALQYVNGQ